MAMSERVEPTKGLDSSSLINVSPSNQSCMPSCSDVARTAAAIALGALLGVAIGTGLGVAFGGVVIAGIIVPVALGPWIGTFATIGAMVALFLASCCDQPNCWALGFSR